MNNIDRRINQGRAFTPFTLLQSQLSRSARQFAIIASLLAGAAAHAAYTPPGSGLVSWWRGEGNASDSAGSNSGSLVGGVNYAPGSIGNGFSFNGTGYVAIPHNASLNFSTSLTIGLWYNSALNNDVYYGLLDKRVGSAGANYGINFAPGVGLGVYYDDSTVTGGDDFGSDFETSRYAPAPGPGAFHHLAATYTQLAGNVVELKTYLDGQLVRTLSISGNLANTLNTAPITIGATAQGSGEYFSGVIDEVVLYNRALTGAEVLTLATVPEPGVGALLSVAVVGMVALRKRQ